MKRKGDDIGSGGTNKKTNVTFPEKLSGPNKVAYSSTRYANDKNMEWRDINDSRYNHLDDLGGADLIEIPNQVNTLVQQSTFGNYQVVWTAIISQLFYNSLLWGRDDLAKFLIDNYLLIDDIYTTSLGDQLIHPAELAASFGNVEIFSYIADKVDIRQLNIEEKVKKIT